MRFENIEINVATCIASATPECGEFLNSFDMEFFLCIEYFL